MQLIHSPSPNFNARPEGAGVDTIVIHYTGMQTGADALARLCDPASQVSSHYLIDEDGTAYALVDENSRAWHAGVSYWAGRQGLNDFSVGIELVNPGHEWGYRPFPLAQMQACARLCQKIMEYSPVNYVLAHSDIAPMRKADPGEKFNWGWLASHGVGIWPEIHAQDWMDGDTLLANPEKLKDAFIACGYDPGLDGGVLATAFNRHFNGHDRPEMDQDGAARLAWLAKRGGFHVRL